MDVNQCPCWCPPSVQGKGGKRESGLKESAFDLALSEWHSLHSGQTSAFPERGVKSKKGSQLGEGLGRSGQQP